MAFDSLRPFLYPLGIAAHLLFGLRFFFQWIQSEKKGASVVPKNFWRFSLIGNLLMSLHGYLQLQLPVCLIQALNAMIAWRNLNLMQTHTLRKRTFLTGLALLLFLLSYLFTLQGNFHWMRSPSLPWSSESTLHLPWIWHLFGFAGMVLFASRFWIQWWLAEKKQRSYLGKSFWWISCVGGFCSLLYFIQLKDAVNILGYSIGLIPYIRNLMLMQKQQFKQKPIDKNSLYLLAGEQSGDLLGGKLIEVLKEKTPLISLFGVGGSAMKRAGMHISHPMERLQVMGFSDVFKTLPRLYRDYQKIKREILEKQPAGVVMIDYPDFNMLLAKSLRKRGYRGKLIHYVSPSVWAWRKKRVYTLANTLDHLLTILPFEKDSFTSTSLPVTYVGHPLVATIKNYPYDPNWLLPKPHVAIFPGSRRNEITLNLPLQLAAARRLGSDYTLAISSARPEFDTLIRSFIGDNTSYVLVPNERRYELMRSADAALATSGTVTLELGLHGVPTCVTYRLAQLNYFLGRYIFRIHLPFYTLVNIICEKEVYPEFIHKKLDPSEIATALQTMLENPNPCKEACKQLSLLLENRDASVEAAQTIEKVLL